MLTKPCKICFICVNYNSYVELKNYIGSIITAKIKTSFDLKIDVLIADNSEKHETILFDNENDVTIQHIFNIKNTGYLGGVKDAISKSRIELKKYDFVIISNVDVIISSNFFEELVTVESDNIFWIAPSIFSLKEKKDRNPKIITRPTKLKMYLLYLMYRFPLIYGFVVKFTYKNKKVPTLTVSNYIYAGHGSFMIFTKLFINEALHFDYPCFLFGEEIFFAELITQKKGNVVYAPNICIHDVDHISTGELKRKSFYKYNYDSIRYLIKEYYSE